MKHENNFVIKNFDEALIMLEEKVEIEEKEFREHDTFFFFYNSF